MYEFPVKRILFTRDSKYDSISGEYNIKKVYC